MAIIVSQRSGKACVVQESGVEDEAQLERYVAENPESLPLDDIKENARLMVVARQFETESGAIDVLAIDGDGDIYVIETKLYKNPDKRLVVAQVLDYGASLWRGYSEPATFISELDAMLVANKRGKLAEAASNFFKLDEEKASSLIESIKANLQTGNIRFIVLMNRLHDALKNLILFLNQRSGFHIYAVEMEFYRHDDLEIVIPKLFGTEAGGHNQGRTAAPKWNRESFLADARGRIDQKQLSVVGKLLDFAAEHGVIRWGTGKSGSFSASFPPYDDESVFYLRSDGTLSLCSIPLPRHGKEVEEFLAARKVAFVARGIAVGARGRYDDCCDYPPDQWTPRVDDFIAVIRGLVREA